MIFSCGETREAKEARLKEWHDFFPLFPRTVAVENGREICAWFQTIQRRLTFYRGYAGDWADAEYRTKPGEL